MSSGYIVLIRSGLRHFGMTTSPVRTLEREALLGLVSILGFSFWSWIGFPFANHNESYAWIVQLNQMGFFDALTQRMKPAKTYRPPIQQGYLDAYLNSLRRLSEGDARPRLIVSFGEQPGARENEKFRVTGRYAGDAVVIAEPR